MEHCLSQFGWLLPSHSHTIPWISELHGVPEMRSCCIPSFLSSRLPLWPSSCGSGFCVTSRLRQVCSTSCQDWPKVLLGENNPQPVDYSSWECSSSSSGQWRISREAIGNSWDGFIIWISFRFFEIELHFLQFLNKNKLFQTLNKQSPGFRSQASNFFFVIWSRTVHTLYLAEKNSYLFC